jgi:hypothetical protein
MTAWFVAKEAPLPRISPFPLGQERVRRAPLENLHDSRWSADFRFRDQKVNMFGHHDISDDHEPVLLPRLFEYYKESFACARRIEEGQTVIARVRDKVQVIGTISPMQAGRHDNLMLSAASFPPLQKSQERGTRSSETGKTWGQTERNPIFPL